ncbi:MAG: chemotaxis protein [Firmicutes bacterium]|nr:chemotaxis protein [Bacillota bacterium]
MPGGNPTPQSIATRKYEAKAGWISKSYKLKKEVVEAFAKACKNAGTSQAAQLTKMMNDFINEQNK